jgi:hypothetical protein
MKRRSGGWADGRAAATNRWAATLMVAIVAVACPPDRLTAQTAQTALTPDTARHVGPVGALWRSMLLPGWGQAATGRHVTGALFVVWEGTTMYMTLKARQEANFLEAAGLPNQNAKRQEVQDWMVLWGFNHLFSGAEAYVAAHLRDFPRDLKVRAIPGGVGVSIPLPHP